MCPFVIRHSRRIHLSGFSIDWEVPFVSEPRVLAVQSGQTSSVDLEFPCEFAFCVHNERLFLSETPDATQDIANALEFDAQRRETAFGVHDNYAVKDHHRAELIGERQVRLFVPFASLPTPGNVFVLTPGHRLCPAMSALDSQSIQLRDVTVHHCPGMGFIAQRCRDVRLQNFVVAPSGERMTSASADGAHFVNCAGHIELSNCRFENQLDDPVNVHGLYSRISQLLSENEVEVELVHHEQRGIPIAEVGDEMGLVRNDTLATYATARVSHAEWRNRSFSRLRFEDPLPPDLQIGHVLENHEWRPDVTISGCLSRGNRARGFLLSSAGRVLIEDNTFHTPDAAILIAGDANYWFESGAVRDVTIRNNVFDSCLYGVWGKAVIDICPEIGSQHGDSGYHRGITIENNRFLVLDDRLLAVRGVAGLCWRDNTIEPSTDTAYRGVLSQRDEAPPEVFCDIEDCRDVFL